MRVDASWVMVKEIGAASRTLRMNVDNLPADTLGTAPPRVLVFLLESNLALERKRQELACWQASSWEIVVCGAVSAPRSDNERLSGIIQVPI
jgi:hypothetical protein